MNILNEQDRADFDYLLKECFTAVAQGALTVTDVRSSIMRAIVAVDDGDIQEVRRMLRQGTEATELWVW